MTRYETFLAATEGDDWKVVYSVWLRERIQEWAAPDSRRGKEVAQEKKQGWQFPILRSPQDHEEFDAWLARWILEQPRFLGQTR